MLFAYRCRERDGSERDGLLEALDESQARAELRLRGWTVLRLSSVEPVQRQTTPVQRLKAPAQPRLPQGPELRLSLQEVSLLLAQVSALCGAGVPIHRAFHAATPRLAQVCEHLSRCLEQGARVSEALATVPRSFSPVMVGLLRVGEESGRMVEILAALARDLNRELRSWQRLAGALAYPTFALLACGSLLALLVGVMLPAVLPLLPAGELPWTTRLLLSLDLRWPLGLLLVSGGLAAQAARTPEGSASLREWFYGLGPPRRALWARLARSLALMLASGMSTEAALRALREPTCGSLSLDDALEGIARSLEEGATLSQALEACPACPRALVRMLGAAEEVGRPERFLESWAELAELQLESEREAMLALLEPALVLFMGMAVAFVVTAVFLPLYGSLA